MGGMFGGVDFSDHSKSIEEEEDKEEEDYGSRLEGQEWRRRQVQLQRHRMQQLKQQQMMRQRQRLMNADLDNSESENREQLPPNGSGGGIHMPVKEGEKEEILEHPGLPTVDRRPGRPTFHHMGPQPGRGGGGSTTGPQQRFPQAPLRRRQHQQMMLRRQQQQAMFNRRMGVAASRVPTNPIREAERLLGSFDSFIALAESEVMALKAVADNITASGRQVNLRNVMTAVNATMRDNPDSVLARLMNRFYNRYLVEEENSNVVVRPAQNDRSLSSLLFLSFGIFLLNSVNDIIAARGLGNGDLMAAASNPRSRGRSLEGDDSDVLGDLGIGGQFMRDLMPSPADAAAAEGKSLEAPKPSANSYMRLLMNLMNAYYFGGDSEDKEREVDCIWTAYCDGLNRQASLGGMVSTVARINSVGMRVLLKETPAERAAGKVLKALVSGQWEEIPCKQLFPMCKAESEEKEGRGEEKAADAAESS